jgi:ABC-type transport system involved in cytochrome c biogenesis permease component
MFLLLVDTESIAAWVVSFLTIGFCKICYSLISGLSAIAMVYAGPDNSDMIVASVVLGLFAPVLSFVIASNSGFSALSTVTHTAQSFGLNAGISSYVVSRDSSPKPSSNKGSDSST